MSGIEINDNVLEFLSDWKKRTDDQQRKYMLLTVGGFVLAFIACVATFSWFQNENYNRIVDRNMAYIQDSAVQETNQVEREMNSAVGSVVNLAKQYATLAMVDDEAAIKDRVAQLRDKTIFDRIAFITPDGFDISMEGSATVSDRNYFKNGIGGKTGWEAIEKSRVTGRPCVAFYAPVKQKNDIIGVMVGFYEQQRMDELFAYNYFNYNPQTYLILKNGSLIASSDKNLQSGNMLIRLSEKQFTGDVNYDHIKEVINDKSRTTITFSYVDSGKTKVGTIVQFSNSDWMIMSVLPGEVTEEMVIKANALGKGLLAAIIITFLLIVLMMSIFFKKQRERLEHEMSYAMENLEASISDERRQLAIIGSLADVYTSVYYIDLGLNRYTRIKENPNVEGELPETGVADMQLRAYVDSFVDPHHRDEMHRMLDLRTVRERLQTYGSVSLEYQRISGEWRRGTLVVADRDSTGIKSIVFAVQNIVNEKQEEQRAKEALQDAYEAAQLASEAKLTFLSNMSHDMRTPLNAVIGMAAIAGANLDNSAKVADCLRKINMSGKHLLALINEILDMSKIESGKVELAEDSFNLSDTIDELISVHQPLIDEKGHTLSVKIKELRHENVIGDSTRLQQVFSNLLSNAIKYTPDNGRISITISEKATNKPNIGFFEIVFEDNGIGMSEEFMATMFEPFSRARDNRITSIQGTGLGMPIARNIIRMMGGDIKVQSKVDQGSRFTVSLAIRLQTEEAVDYSRFVDLDVLVVDDDPITCESTCALLDSIEMHSEYVTTGEEAVERTVAHHEAENDYYAVIIDWRMPGMNGLETTRRIRSQVGDDVPIIIISAYDWSQIETEAREAGANAFLSKPLFKSRVVNLFDDLTSGSADIGNEPITLAEQAEEHDFNGKRVLLVEDNMLNSEIAVEMLSMLGVETVVATNGQLGVEALESSAPGYYDMIFMDIQMPVMNGYDAAKAIRASQHPDADIPIVAMTANAFSTDVRAAFDAGMNGHISKPVDISQIINALHDNIDNNADGE